ncbi:MAG: DUF3795 domain-containing protein [Dehalococcoidia bacterium]
MQREQVNCSGCKGDSSKFFICGLCQIRECAVTKRLSGCNLCSDYACHRVNLLTGGAALKIREEPHATYCNMDRRTGSE